MPAHVAGEVVSIAQLASLAGRPVPTGQGSKPVTFQLQGNKLTLSGTQLHQVPVQQPRPLHGEHSRFQGQNCMLWGLNLHLSLMLPFEDDSYQLLISTHRYKLLLPC